MSWFLIACLSRISFAFCNILDAHFSNGVFKNAVSQTFFFGLYVLFLVLIFPFFYDLTPLPVELFPWCIVAGACLALHGIPYLSALRQADTSIVVSLFTLGRVFAPILSIFLVNEELNFNEYAGFVITLIGCLWHAYKPTQARIDVNLVLKMILSGLMVAGFSVCSKKIFLEADVITGMYYVYLFDAICSVSTILIPRYQKDTIDTLKMSKVIVPYSSVVFFALLGHTLSFYAISLTKVTYVILIGQFQAFFALLISVFLYKVRQLKHKESLLIPDMYRKCVGFLIMALGAYVAIEY